MDKIKIKLIAMALALTLSVSVVIMSSYAWMVLSSSPAATGIQVVIGGGNTILIAPNIAETVDGETFNIPGHFSDRMNFGMYDSYSYLEETGGLTPVSTSNGIDWFIKGNKVDSFLENANVPKYVEDGEGNKQENSAIREGNYIYLDFWVVAPSGDYTLRVSTGTEDSEGGSFVIDLLEPVKDEEGKLVLQNPEGSAAAAVRIGFLANPITLMDDSMLCYTESSYADDRFTSLRGLYIEPGKSFYTPESNFVIYEPNADYHPGNGELEGTYVQTKPLMLDENGEITENADIWNQLAVQLKSGWIPSGEGSYTVYEEFGAAAINNRFDGMETAGIMSDFYITRLRGQFSQYVSKGKFITNTSSLINPAAENSGKISAAQIGGLQQSGAAEDIEIIKLERNVPQRIRMFIWLEGQDIDCAASANSARFAVNIEFAGGNE